MISYFVEVRVDGYVMPNGQARTGRAIDYKLRGIENEIGTVTFHETLEFVGKV
jgi:hypothetical protein